MELRLEEGLLDDTDRSFALDERELLPPAFNDVPFDDVVLPPRELD